MHNTAVIDLAFILGWWRPANSVKFQNQARIQQNQDMTFGGTLSPPPPLNFQNCEAPELWVWGD